jgi:hypothetical protein
MKKAVTSGARHSARVVAGKRVADGRVKSGLQPRKPLPGRGSAIFLHLARPGLTPTDGCIALDEASLRKIIARIGPRTRILIG